MADYHNSKKKLVCYTDILSIISNYISSFPEPYDGAFEYVDYESKNVFCRSFPKKGWLARSLASETVKKDALDCFSEVKRNTTERDRLIESVIVSIEENFENSTHSFFFSRARFEECGFFDKEGKCLNRVKLTLLFSRLLELDLLPSDEGDLELLISFFPVDLNLKEYLKLVNRTEGAYNPNRMNRETIDRFLYYGASELLGRRSAKNNIGRRIFRDGVYFGELWIFSNFKDKNSALAKYANKVRDIIQEEIGKSIRNQLISRLYLQAISSLDDDVAYHTKDLVIAFFRSLSKILPEFWSLASIAEVEDEVLQKLLAMPGGAQHQAIAKTHIYVGDTMLVNNCVPTYSLSVFQKQDEYYCYYFVLINETSRRLEELPFAIKVEFDSIYAVLPNPEVLLECVDSVISRIGNYLSSRFQSYIESRRDSAQKWWIDRNVCSDNEENKFMIYLPQIENVSSKLRRDKSIEVTVQAGQEEIIVALKSFDFCTFYALAEVAPGTIEHSELIFRIFELYSEYVLGNKCGWCGGYYYFIEEKESTPPQRLIYEKEKIRKIDEGEWEVIGGSKCDIDLNDEKKKVTIQDRYTTDRVNKLKEAMKKKYSGERDKLVDSLFKTERGYGRALNAQCEFK